MTRLNDRPARGPCRGRPRCDRTTREPTRTTRFRIEREPGMAKKLDMSRAKEFLFKHGERVALFTCAGIALLLVVYSTWGAVGAGTVKGEPIHVALKKAEE